jgi:uncharacterized delta-60 repeat protein
MKTQIALIATLIGGALIACTQNEPATVKTSVLEPIGYGSITFVDDSQGQPALNLKSKALTGYNSGFIQLKRISVNSFTVGARPSATTVGGYRYVSFTFAVRNASETGVASSAPRSNLTIIPVSVSSGTHATLNSPLITPFSALGKFDGTAASNSIAPEVQPTHGSRFNPFTGLAEVRNNQADLQVFTEAEMTSLVASAASGWPSTYTPFPYGYVVRNKYNTSNRTLGADPPVGQFDGLVTFGFKVPLQATVTDDPFAYSVEFVIAQDNVARVTKSNEESSATRAQAEATALGGSTVADATVCTVRYAGAAGSVASRYLYGFGARDSTNHRDSCFSPPYGSIRTYFSPNYSTYHTDVGNATVVQSDAKILVTGKSLGAGGNFDFALARLNPNGTFDSSFGSSGKTSLDFAGFNDEAFAIAMQSDGKILLGGSAGTANSYSDNFALARYNANGTLDSSFGTGGKVTLDFQGFQDQAKALVLQPDGTILLAGNARNSSGNDNFAVARFATDGTLDPSFGDFSTPGKATFDLAGFDDAARAMALTPDGGILLAGPTVGSAFGPTDFGLIRLTRYGTLLFSFGTNGVVSLDFAGNYDTANAMTLQSDGKILLAGQTMTPAGISRFALARLSAAGVLDSSFGTGGKTTYGFSGDMDYATSMALQSDGKILLGGVTRHVQGNNPPTSDLNFVLARFNSNGVLDSGYYPPTLGYLNVGIGNTNIPTNDELNSITVQQDGRILVLGTVSDPITGSSDFAVARYNP